MRIDQLSPIPNRVCVSTSVRTSPGVAIDVFGKRSIDVSRDQGRGSNPGPDRPRSSDAYRPEPGSAGGPAPVRGGAGGRSNVDQNHVPRRSRGAAVARGSLPPSKGQPAGTLPLHQSLRTKPHQRGLLLQPGQVRRLAQEVIVDDSHVNAGTSRPRRTPIPLVTGRQASPSPDAGAGTKLRGGSAGRVGCGVPRPMRVPVAYWTRVGGVSATAAARSRRLLGRCARCPGDRRARRTPQL